MCMFSGEVEHVSSTRIFARTEAGRQALIYSMAFSASSDLAMVLALPTPAGAADDAVEFVNLEDYPDVFDDLEAGFPKPERLATLSLSLSDAPATLQVHSVGDFEASFVPSRADFARLDPRFRLPEQLELPESYAGFGFAVFKLKAGRLKGVHPMAFWFPTRFASHVFFPLLHVHDGKLEPSAMFDHTLFLQGKYKLAMDWRESPNAARSFVEVRRAKGLIAPELTCRRYEMRGSFQNQDWFLEAVA